MNNMNFVFFPYMHSILIPSSLQGLGQTLNPGLSTDKEGLFTPKDYPLDPRQASRHLADFYRFGEQFNTPRDMGYYTVNGLEDFYSESTMAIKSELTGGTPSKEDAQKDRALKMQSMLLLGYALEERLLDIEQFGVEIDDAWKKFEKNLGLNAEDKQFVFPNDPDSLNFLSAKVEWKKLIAPFAYFMESGQKLLIWDDNIITGIKANLHTDNLVKETEKTSMAKEYLHDFDPEFVDIPLGDFSPAFPGYARVSCIFLRSFN